MKRLLLLLCIFLSLVSLTSCGKPKIESKTGVYINEVCTDNQAVLKTEDYEYYDWVELYNSTEEDIYLEGYGLSDNSAKPFRFTFPRVTIKAKDYLIIYCDKEAKGDRIAPFGLSNKGESLYLTMPNEELADYLAIPSLPTDVSYGRYYIDEALSFEFLNPSPMEQNETKPIYKEILSPTFSQESGFYATSFSLVLDSPTKNCSIYYTLDSSIPDKNSHLYTGSIEIDDPSKEPNVLKSREDISSSENKYKSPVDKCVIVRAVAIADDGNQSPVVTKSYFIDKTNYAGMNVVSLVSDTTNLIDPIKGIYVRGKAYEDYLAKGSSGKAPLYNWDYTGRDWERDCTITYFDDGVYSFTQDCGMRIHGFGGRLDAIKSFNLYARKCYGMKYFQESFFEDKTKTKSVLLRYDRFSSLKEKFRDGFVQSLMKDRDVSIQDYVQCYVFLDGEFWQTYSIMEKYSDDYFEQHYNVEKEEVIGIKDDLLDVGTDNDYKEYVNLKNYIKKTDFTKEQNYRELCNKIDIQSFIDFYCGQIYVNSIDFSYKKNYYVWKSKEISSKNPYADGKWRWAIYDWDLVAIKRSLTKVSGETEYYDYTFNPLTGVFMFATDLKDDPFLPKLMKNKQFQQQFILSFMDIANENFNSETVKALLLEQYDYQSGIISEFFDNRFNYIVKYVADYCGIDATLANVSIEASCDFVLNTMKPTLKNTSWSGNYFKEYPLTMEFDHSINFQGTGIEILEKTDNKVVFKIVSNDVKIVIS